MILGVPARPGRLVLDRILSEGVDTSRVPRLQD